MWRRCGPGWSAEPAITGKKSSAGCGWRREEIRHWVEFDHVVVNEDLAVATETVRAVLHAARSATGRLTGLRGFVEGLE